jgi:hypothetical protein
MTVMWGERRSAVNANRVRTGVSRIFPVILICLVIIPTAHADVLFDNYNGSYLTSASPNWGCAVIGQDVPCGSPNEQAIRFTVSSGGLYNGFYLNTVTLPLSLFNSWDCLPDPDHNVYVGLYANDPTNIPGSPIETVCITVSSTAPAEVIACFSGTTVLDDGVTYWVVLVGNVDSNHIWSYPDPPIDTGSRMHRYGFDRLWKAGENDPAVRVEGVPTGPVPVQMSTWGQIKSLYR